MRPPVDAERAARRSCGECSLCCTVLRVDELRKLGGTPCRALARAPAHGCSIHATRPEICRTYRCLWLQGAFEEEDRPDRLGAVLDLLGDAGVARLAVREASPGAVDRSPRLREIVEQYRGFMPVRVASAADVMNPDAPFRLFLPEGEERLVSGDRVEVRRSDRAVAIERLPAFERWVRRIVLRWRRFRFRNYGAGELPLP